MDKTRLIGFSKGSFDNFSNKKWINKYKKVVWRGAWTGIFGGGKKIWFLSKQKMKINDDGNFVFEVWF